MIPNGNSTTKAIARFCSSVHSLCGCACFVCVRFVALSEDEIGRAVVRVVRCFEGKGMQPLFGRLV